MKFLKNLRIKNKLRIPMIFLLILSGVFIYFYFRVDSLIESEIKGKAAITEAGTKMKKLFCAITDYFNGKIPYDRLNTDYLEIMQLAEKEEIFAGKERQGLTALGGELKKADTTFKEISRLQEQVFERTASYAQQSLDFLAEKKIILAEGNIGVMSRLLNLGQKVSHMNVLFLEAKEQKEENIKLVELLDLAGQEIEKEALSLKNTPFVPLPQKAKEAIMAGKEIAPKFIENIKNIKTAKENITALFNELSGVVSQIETDKTAAFFTAIKGTFHILLIAILVIILLTILLGYITAKFIRVPLSAMIERAHELAVGKVDMTKRLQVTARDEIGELSDWFNQFLERLHQLLVKVKNSSDEVYNATKEITAGSENLATRTNEQAVSITETSTTLEKFSEAIRQSTENSAEADMMLVDFNQQIQEKSSLIDNVTKTMTEIYNSSKQIDNIIKVINDISFQTNLLALNAAVEAARAGEAGRGFAVVAAEVRNLAQKTAESSKTIQNIVLQNVESTQKGMELVKHTSEFFSEIVGVMGEIVQKVSNITTVSREQSANIEQIAQAIAQMDQVATRNAALVGELSETGKKVKNNAVDLQDLVLHFKVDETSPAPEEIKILKGEKTKNKPSAAPPVEKKKEREKVVEKRITTQKTASPLSTTSTEDDFFGATNDEGFEEF